MSSAAPSPSLRSLFAELEQLFQSETEARVSTSVEAAERALAEHLNQAVRRLRQAGDFSEMAGVLCDASAPFARACGVFRANGWSLTGERARGALPEWTSRFGEIRCAPPDAAAFAGALESGEPVAALCSAAEVSAAVLEAFGPADGEKAHLFPLTKSETSAGVLFALGVTDSAALELLAQAAGAVLEARDRPVTPAELVRITPAPAQPESAPAWDQLSAAEQHLHLAAQRFARVKVAEMQLYRADVVKSGRDRKDLYSALQPDIDQARAEFRQTFATANRSMPDYIHVELVRTLARGDEACMGGTYPGRMG